MENFWLFAFVVAVFGVEWKFYSWHTPQVEALEKMRHEQIRAAIDRYLENHKSKIVAHDLRNSLHELFNQISSDKDIVLPVGGSLNPHRKIFRWLLIAVVLSGLFALVGLLCAQSPTAPLHFPYSESIRFYVKLLLGIATFGPVCIASWLGWGEFHYVLRITDKFKTHSLSHNTDGLQSAIAKIEGHRDEILATGDTRQTKSYESRVSKPQAQDKDPGLDDEQIRVLTLFANTQHHRVYSEAVAKILEIHPLKAEQLLDGLKQQGLVHFNLALGGPSGYSLASAGRDYLIQKRIVQ